MTDDTGADAAPPIRSDVTETQLIELLGATQAIRQTLATKAVNPARLTRSRPPNPEDPLD